MVNENKKESTVTPSLIITVVLGTLFVLSSFACSFANISFDDDSQTIENLLEKSVSNEQTTEDDGVQATQYNFFPQNDYNQIVEFTDKGVQVYAFRKETDTDVGNDGTKFEYELGRIQINPKDKNDCQCTYNFRASYDGNKVDWFKCSEKSFIESLPQIIALKQKKFKALKESIDWENLVEVCDYVGMEDDDKCKNLPNRNYDEVEKLRQKQLAELRNAKL